MKYTILYNELYFIKKRIKTYYDKYKVKELSLKKGNKVYFFKRYIYIKRLSNKFDFKKLGLFRVK